MGDALSQAKKRLFSMKKDKSDADATADALAKQRQRAAAEVRPLWPVWYQ